MTGIRKTEGLEQAEALEDIAESDVADRLEKDPESQRNREEMSDPANREDGADGR